MVVLDYLAYQHRDDWEKLGFTIVDAIGTAKLDFGDQKVVTARPLTGVDYAMQVFSDVEGVDQAKLAPFAVREVAPDIKTVASVEECGASLNGAPTPTMEADTARKEGKALEGKSDFKTDEGDKTLSVDEAFL